MKHFFKEALKSVWTSLLGTIAGLPTLVTGIHTHNTTAIVVGAATILTGLAAKDAHQ
jgi:branched-subunit amino acid transport protein